MCPNMATPATPTNDGDMDSNIQDFYKGRCLFITGFTGFMGKVLVEKLLRACPGIDTVYVLMRPQKGKDVACRLEQLLKSKIYEHLTERDSSIFSKLVPVCGDITQPKLGMSDSDQQLLQDSVSIVFHGAATVRFNEKLKKSIDHNVVGTWHVINLCQRMKKLEALIHVSTAYSNCHLRNVNEVVVPMAVDPKNIIETFQWMDDNLANAINTVLLGERPNNYTYTKALAESLLAQEGQHLPVAIFRPSIVVASWKEPMPGWIDNINGPTGIMLGVATGILHAGHIKENLTCDIVPVDVAINMMIAVAWFTATNRPNHMHVYNCTSGNMNPINWARLMQICYNCALKFPTMKAIWWPSFTMTSMRIHYDVVAILYHTVPAYIFDGLRYLSGRKPQLVKIQKKTTKLMEILSYFTTNEWDFSNDNLYLLWECMSANDKEDYCFGIRQYILGEVSDSIPAARKRLKRLLMLRYLSYGAGLLVCWHLLVSKLINLY